MDKNNIKINETNQKKDNSNHQEMEYLEKHYESKIGELNKCKEDKKILQKSLDNCLNEYKILQNAVIEKEEEIQSVLTKICKIKKIININLNQFVNKKFFSHISEISKNKNKEEIFLKIFNFMFFTYNLKTTSDNKKNITTNKVNSIQSMEDFLSIINNENEIRNLLFYQYNILDNLMNVNEKLYLKLKNDLNESLNHINSLDKQYPFDFLYDYLKNVFLVIDSGKEVKSKQNDLNRLIKEKNIKFVNMSNIEFQINSNNKNSNKINNYLHNFNCLCSKGQKNVQKHKEENKMISIESIKIDQISPVLTPLNNILKEKPLHKSITNNKNIEQNNNPDNNKLKNVAKRGKNIGVKKKQLKKEINLVKNIKRFSTKPNIIKPSLEKKKEKKIMLKQYHHIGKKLI